MKAFDVKISGFYDEVSYSLDKQIALIKEFGEQYMCPRFLDKKNIADYTYMEFMEKIRPRLRQFDIKFSSIGSPIGKIDVDDEVGLAKQKSQLTEMIKICKEMDCKYIRIFSFFYKDRAPDSIHDKVVANTKELLSLVKGTDVILLHENEKGIYGDTPERCKKLYDDVHDEQFALCYDASNYIQCDVDPLYAYDLLKDYTVYYHIKDCSKYKVEVPLGLGLGKYTKIFDDLKKRKYNGFMTLEPHTVKYALLKLPIYFVPFLCIKKKNMYKTFRLIDKQLGIPFFKSVSRRKVFEWQYNTLKSYLGIDKRNLKEEYLYGKN